MKERTALLAIGLVLLVILIGACRTTQSTGSTAPAATATQPATPASAPAPAVQACAANFTATGNLFAGQTVKSFQEFPNASKNPTFTYLVTKISSLGYKVNASDRESGLISASKAVAAIKATGGTNDLNAVLTPLDPTGIRVELTYHAGVYGDISPAAARKEFCSILEGVPADKKPVAAKPAEEVKPIPAAQPEAKQPPSTQPSLRNTTVIVPSENLRQTPKGKIIGKVNKGISLGVLEEQDKWLRVRLEDGTEAWIWKASTSGGN
jgi:hypothetical protein